MHGIIKLFNMNTFKTLFSVLSVAIAVSCGSASRNIAPVELHRISFDLSKMEADRAPKMSDMVEDIEYVPLGEVPGTPIDGISRPVITDEYIYFIEYRIGIMQFTRDGKFVRRIGSIGRGPGEFISLTTIHVDEKEGILYTLRSSGPDNIVGRYDLATGRFIGEAVVTEADGAPTSYIIRQFLSLSDDAGQIPQGVVSVTSYLGSVWSFAVLDLPSAKIIHREKSMSYGDSTPEELRGRHISIIWYDAEGRVNFFEPLADTMYVINSDFTYSPRAVADFGNMKPGSFDMENPDVLISSIVEGRRYMIFMATAASTFKLIYFDKETGESSTSWPFFSSGAYLSTGVENDFDGGFAHLTARDENLGYAYFHAFDMKNALTPEHFEKVRQKVKYPEKLEKLQALVASLNEEDNPVFAIAHLKK